MNRKEGASKQWQDIPSCFVFTSGSSYSPRECSSCILCISLDLYIVYFMLQLWPPWRALVIYTHLKLMDGPWLALLEAGTPPYWNSWGDAEPALGMFVRAVSHFLYCQRCLPFNSFNCRSSFILKVSILMSICLCFHAGLYDITSGKIRVEVTSASSTVASREHIRLF